MMRALLAATAVALAVALAAPGATSAGARAGRTVGVFDNYYAPAKLNVRRGTVVVWKWPSGDAAGDVHDVALRRGPRGVRKFASEPAASGYSFRRKLTVPGRYFLVCTLHEEMTMRITVRR